MTSRPSRKRYHVYGLLGVMAVAAALAWSGLSPHQARAQGGKPVVHVFLQLDAKSSVVEKTLQGKLSGLSITVFSRFRDFDDAGSAGKPDALLSIAPVLESRGAKSSLQGMRGGKGTEAYVLASVGQPL